MKIICIGRNYVNHAKELGNKIPSDPVVFLKPDSAILPKNKPFFIPDFSNEIHYETEIVVKINKIGKYVQPQFAQTYYNQITVGLDLTARDLQTKLKTKGLPWEKAKGFDGSAVLGEFIDKSQFDLTQTNFTLRKNKELVQEGNTKDMLFSIDTIIAYVSQYFTLKIGDLIFTGTPEGVGKIAVNDVLEASIESQKLLNLKIK